MSPMCHPLPIEDFGYGVGHNIGTDVDVSDLDLEYNKNYLVHIYAIFDYYDKETDSVIKKTLLLNRRNAVVNLRALAMPEFVVSREAKYVDNDYVTNSDSSKPGSVFINSYRTIYPFEARFDTKSNARKIEIIFAEDEKTDIDDVIFSPNDGKEVKIYSLSGHMVGRASQKDFESIWSALPKGVYIVDGKKLVK